MEKSKKIKTILGLLYFFGLILFLFFIFKNFSVSEITSYEFIKNNRNYFYEIKQSNLFLTSLFFLIFTIIWVFAAGFGLPIGLLGGFIFGKWFGTFLVLIGLTLGATILYSFSNYFLKDIIKEKFLERFKNLGLKFKESEFTFLLIYRFIGGIPFAISNVLPCMFNVKIYNFFLATIIGIIPQVFLIVSLGSGLEKIIDRNLEPPKLKDLIFSPDIYYPLLGFFCLIIITVIIRKIFYKK